MIKNSDRPTFEQTALKEKMAELTNKWRNVDVSVGSIEEIRRKIDRTRYRILLTSLRKLERPRRTPKQAAPDKGEKDIVAIAEEIFNV